MDAAQSLSASTVSHWFCLRRVRPCATETIMPSTDVIFIETAATSSDCTSMRW